MKPRIAILFTGGTISMRVDPKTGGPVPALSGEEIIARVEGLNEIADIEVINFALLPGPHMTPPKMLELARHVSEQLADERIAGVVVTHGTDTLEETAYLHDLVINSDKPVVFVGSMRNSSELSWDGPANLRSAVRVAVDPSARGLGVVVVMGDQIIAAAEATKTHTEAVDTFQGRDFGPLGIVDKDRIIITRRPVQCEEILAARKIKVPVEYIKQVQGKDHPGFFLTPPGIAEIGAIKRMEKMGLEKPRWAVTLQERVEIIKLAAGSDGRFIDFAIKDGARGLVIESLGRGNVPVAALPAIERAVKAGIPVVITSRCPRGRVLDTYAYEGAGRQLKRMGAILGGLLPTHKARIKLMLLLGAGHTLEQIKASFEA